MVEGEATQEPTAPEGASASPPAEMSSEPVVAASESEAESVEAESEPAAAATLEADAAPESDAESVAAESEPAAAAESEPAVPAADWSHLRAFQALEPPAEALAARDDYADELRKEFAARAARFARSVDESIVLSSDGLLRWMGDPVARVVAGESLLAPRAVLLADDALAGEDRAAVENRVGLWIAAHIRKVLGPLLALAEGAELPDAARSLGAKIAEALGVLERDRVRAEVKGLDQTARGALRKLGVRFGSLYIYAPLLLKPAARGLCSLVWTLRRGTEAGADRLLAFAAAGRTSFANEGLLSPDSYRVAGYRLCGERVVRVDIIERLSDLIRAAIPDHMRGGSRPSSETYGFVITPPMTSLTGCSGEAFASILRSLGFESAKVSKAAFEAANRKAPTEPIKPAISEEAAEAVETPVKTEAVVSAPTETASQAEEPEAASPDTAPVGAETPEFEAAAGEPVAEAQNGDELSAPPASDPESDSDLESRAEASLESAAPESSDPAHDLSEASEGAAPSPTELASEAPAPELSAQAVPALAQDEEIEIWRPAPRRPRAPQRPHGAEHEAGPSHRGKFRESRRNPRPAEVVNAAEAVASPESPSRTQGRIHRPERRDEGPRRHETKGNEERVREDRRPPKDFGPRRDARPVTVDPDSPFAKLAALKPLLERRDKRP